MAEWHILLIHLVHLGNDSPTFALERKRFWGGARVVVVVEG